MKKILNAIALAADLSFGVLLVIGGLTVMVGGTTGALWL
jgi:hypothetical protein